MGRSAEGAAQRQAAAAERASQRQAAAAERAAELPTTICQPSREEKRQVTILCCSVSVCQPDAGDGLDSDGFEQRESLQRTLCQAFQEAALMRGGTLIGSLGHQFSVMFEIGRAHV